MEEISDIETFASDLENSQRNRSDRLPNASIYQNTVIYNPGNDIKAQDVIAEVTKQMKDIQNADCAESYKKPSMVMNKFKKSTFVSVNMISTLEETHQKPAQSVAGTQLVLDTQLINAMQDAEALATAGLTQEFQSTFPYTGLKDGGDNILNKNTEFPMLDISLKEPDLNVMHHTVPTEFHDGTSKDPENTRSENIYDDLENIQNQIDDEDSKLITDNIIFVDKHDLSIEFGTVKDINDSKHEVILIRENSSEIDKIDSEIDRTQTISDNDVETNEKDIFSQDSDIKIPLSPVLSVKSLKMSRKSCTPSPIVIDLETFEKFEALASPLLININDDTANDLIKSSSFQITERDKTNNVSLKVNVLPKTNEKEEESNDCKSQSILEPMDIDFATNTHVLEHSESKSVIIEDLILAGLHTNCYDRNVTLLEKNNVLENDAQNKTNHKTEQNYDETNAFKETLHDIKNNKRFIPEDKKNSSNELLKDEILFSSDEEEEYINIHKNNQNLPLNRGLETHRHNQDLPLTCVLETSFYDEDPDVLNKTMYVGFQTASDKSIKVLTDSFCRAKSFLSEDLWNEAKEIAVTELVDHRSTKESNIELYSVKDEKNDTKHLLKSNKISRMAQLNEMMDNDKVFETKLEEIKERITNTISSDVFVTCDDSSNTTASLEILVPEKFNRAPVELSKLNGSDLAVKNNDGSFESCEAEDNSQLNNAQVVLPISQALITKETKENDTKSTINMNIENTETHNTETNNVTDYLTEKLKNKKDRETMAKKNVKEADNQVKSVSIESLIESDVEPFSSSQIISFKSIKPLHKRKKDFPHTGNKKLKLSRASESQVKEVEVIDEKLKSKTEKSEIQAENEFEDMEFNTCDFKEILIKENLKKAIDKDEVDSKIESKSAVIVKQSPVVEEKSPVFEKDVLDFDIREMLIQENLNKLLSDATNPEKVSFHQKITTAENSNKDLVNSNKSLKTHETKEILENMETSMKAKPNEDTEATGEILQDTPNQIVDIEHRETLNGTKTSESTMTLDKTTTETIKTSEVTKSEDMKTSTTNSQNIESESENSEEPPFLGFSNEDDKVKALEEIAKFKKLFEEFCFDQSIFEQNDLNKYCEANFVKSDPEVEALKRECSLEMSNNLEKSHNIEKCISTNKSMASESNRKVSIPLNVEVEGSETHNHEKVKMSEEALIKIEYYFKDLDKFSPEKLPNKSENVSVFQGFKTASRKPITISDNALAKGRKLLQDINTRGFEMPAKMCNEKLNKMSEPKGFKGPGKKLIMMSSNALERTKKIFQNVDKVICESNIQELKSLKTSDPVYKTPVKKTINDISKVNKYSSTKKDVDEISTASRNSCSERSIYLGLNKPNNKPVHVTPISSRSKKILESILYSDEDESGVVDSAPVNKIESPLNVFEGFKTASNKDVNISEKALEKGRILLKNVYSKDSETLREILGTEVMQKTTTTSFQGFKTASNKQVNVSVKALEKGRKLFQDIQAKTLPTQDAIINLDDHTDTYKETTAFQGFKTASNMQVKISEKALEKKRKLFQDIDLEMPTKTSNIEVDKIMLPKTTVFEGFQTANNKKVEISEAALEKSRKVMQNFDDKDRGIDQNFSAKQSTNKFQGFRTAGNKEIQISNEALAKSRMLFQNIDTMDLKEPDDSNNQVEKDPQTTVFQDFTTASNKQVKISEKALEKSRQLFQDIATKCLETPDKLNNKMNAVSNKQISNVQGFKTGRNKEIQISEDALAKSKKILDNYEVAEHAVFKNNSFKFEGFQTGSNKKVDISKEALENSRKILQGMNENPENIFQSIEDNPKLINASTFQGFMTANKKNVSISKQALKKSKEMLQNIDSELENCSTNRNKEDFLSDNAKKSIITNKMEDKQLNTANISIENIINTQVLNHFEKSLHSEDFFKEHPKSEHETDSTPKSTKRSDSPILSCPKSKKKKRFEIPYSQKVVKTKNFVEKHVNFPKLEENIVKFEETYKKNKIYTLKDLQKLEKEDTSIESNLNSYILNFDFDNLLEFEFFDERNNLDQAKNRLKIQDLINIFEASVDTKLIPKGWTENHVKLILWKLISYEMKFPKTMKNTCTAKNVLEQLKYRYDKELFSAERPVLRKILEKDDVPGKTMILCIVGYFVDGVLSTASVTSTQAVELLATDGWYTIRCTIDKMLTTLVHRGRIQVGTKIATCGAELVGDDQGVSPWEDTSSIRLKVHGNSTRLARWDARLGCHGNAAILSTLTAVRADGGKVSKLRCAVTRVYPALYVDKFADGSTVTRSERLEHLHQMRYEAERQVIMEKLYDDVQKEFADRDSEDSPEDQPSKQLDSGSQIARQMKMSKDPQEFRAGLTTTQQDLLTDYETKKRESYIHNVRTRIQDKMQQQGLNVTRNVVPLLKVRVVGARERDEMEVTKAMLSIWKPGEAVLEILTEGAWVDMMNVTSTAVRYSELQISAGRQSVFSQAKYIEPENHKPYLLPFKRQCYPIQYLCLSPNITTEYNEIDTAGIIVEIDPEMTKFHCNKHQFQNVYLADAEMNIMCVNFWGGVNKFGFESIMETGQVISCTNLQKRSGNTRKSIPHYRATEYSYFTKTPKNIEARKIVEDLCKNVNRIDKEKFCEDCRSLRSSTAGRLQKHSDNVTPYRFTNVDMNSTKNRAYLDTPIAQRSTKTDENLNLTGLDFESTFQQADTQDLSPRTLLRKRQVKEKIDKLKRYGEPPPLSPLTIFNKSKNAGNAYKSPLISKSDSSGVASDKIIVPNQDKSETCVPTSPIVGLNRTYVKRNVNPVKLNFSTKNEDTFDHFAESFDGSPPLSLE